MLPLLIAAAIWLVLHLMVPATIRPALVARFGVQRYIPVFALSSLAAMIGLILAYRAAPYAPLWPPVPAGAVLAPVLVGAGFILIALGVTAANPATPEGEDAVRGLADPPTIGVVRITRHPVMAGIALWAFAHLLVNGHVAALMLFGTLLFTAVKGMALIDRRRARALGAAWASFEARTSRPPFGAIVAGRNVLRLDEIPWRPVAIGLALFGAAHLCHEWVLGVPPYPP